MFIAVCLIIVPNWKQPKRLTGEWSNKLFAYPNNGIFLRNKTEWVRNTCNSVDESQKHCAALKKCDTKEPTRCASIPMLLRKKQKESTVAGSRSAVVWGKGWRRQEEIFGGAGKFCMLSVVIVTWVFTFIKTHKTIHLIWVYFIVYKL